MRMVVMRNAEVRHEEGLDTNDISVQVIAIAKTDKKHERTYIMLLCMRNRPVVYSGVSKRHDVWEFQLGCFLNKYIIYKDLIVIVSNSLHILRDEMKSMNISE